MKQQETAFSAKKRWGSELSIDCLVGRVYVAWSSPQIPLNNLCFTHTLLTPVLFLGSYYVDENLTTPFNFILGEVLKKMNFSCRAEKHHFHSFLFFAFSLCMLAIYTFHQYSTRNPWTQVFLSPSANTKEEEAFACREVSYIQLILGNILVLNFQKE